MYLHVKVKLKLSGEGLIRYRAYRSILFVMISAASLFICLFFHSPALFFVAVVLVFSFVFFFFFGISRILSFNPFSFARMMVRTKND